ncbi:DegT/DnrJ/EryC1/StrS family aminotransferase, partial [Bacillus velezensis]
ERRYYHTRVGVGGRMDTLQCAIVLAKLGRFDFECERRQHVAGRYLQALAGLQGCELPSLREGNSSVWGQFTVQVDDRAKVVERLTAANVPTAVHYPVPLHQQPAYRDRCRIASSLANSERVAQRVMSLPMSADLDETQQDYIIEQLRAALRD